MLGPGKLPLFSVQEPDASKEETEETGRRAQGRSDGIERLTCQYAGGKETR
jgi:hypothetical protein